MTSVRFRTVWLTVVCLGIIWQPRAAAQVDMRRYVALGDSFTAGYADGGLHQAAQRGGYAQWLAIQAGESGFEQPLMTDPGIPATLRVDSSPSRMVVPRPGLGSPINLTLPRPYDNLSVPGAKVGDLLRASTDGGGLRDLVLRGLGTQLEQAQLLEPTFVSLWIGTGDALGAAVSGLVLDGVTLTPLVRFSHDYNAIVQSLAAGGVEAGVVATIPQVTDLPFVNALPTTAVDARGVPLEFNSRPVPLIGPDGSLTSGDFVLLSAAPLLARGDGVARALGGTGVPLPDQAVLSRTEAARINTRIRAYNRVIRRAAADVGFAVVEISEIFDGWHRSGVVIGGTSFSTEYPAGGLFSLDGVHPSLLGQALLANAFVDAIHEAFGAGVPRIAEPALAALAPLAAPTPPQDRTGVPGFTSRASKNLRFGLDLPRPGQLLRWKRRALELERRRQWPHPADELTESSTMAAAANAASPRERDLVDSIASKAAS